MFFHLKKHWARWTLTTVAVVGWLLGDNRCRWMALRGQQMQMEGYLTDMNSSVFRH